MNVQLYNSLVEAKKFLITVDNNEKELERIKGQISVSGATFKPYFPLPKEKKFEWLKFWFFFAFGFQIGGFIYWWYIRRYNNKKYEEYESKVEKWKNSAEGKIAMQKTEEYRKELNEKYEIKKAESIKYFSANHSKYSYLVGDLKTRESIEHKIAYVTELMEFVKDGEPTLSSAKQRYAVIHEAMYDYKMECEKREQEEQRHKERIKALENIAKNQERANDDLRRLREKYVDRY